MQINWFEIVAQVINFFLILFILQKLLYKPVINAMKSRQERIEKSQIEADEKYKEAEELVIQYDGKIAEIDKEKREILEDARNQAQEKKESLLVDYKEEAENKRKAYLKEIEDEKEHFIVKLRKNLGENAVKIASHILNTISSRELEEEVFNTFVSNLKDLEENLPNKEVLIEEDYVNILSSRNLTDDKKKTIESILKAQMKNIKNVNFQVDESLILGYELDLETYTVHTNIKHYLENIEKEIINNLDTN